MDWWRSQPTVFGLWASPPASYPDQALLGQRLNTVPCAMISFRLHADQTNTPSRDLYGRKRLTRLCPHCHGVLSSNLGTGPAIYISLVGGRSSGKTAYLLAACQALMQNSSHRLRVAFADTIQELAFERDLHSLQEQ